ncbi:MAG: hypothetical protein HQL93_01180 [Magnetococcales bacterium]|nr:hypothetical protein [Magnetococcales bacterium]
MKIVSARMALLGILILSGGYSIQESQANEPVSVPKTAGSGGGEQTNKWSTNPAQIAQRMESLNTLLNTSTGAQRIQAANNPEATALREKALAQLREGKAAFQRQDYDAAKKSLAQASQAMFEAMRKADGGASEREKQLQDFDRRLASVKVLQEAHTRISTEKGRGQETNVEIQKAMDEATKLHQDGKLPQARSRLDEGYILAKMGIEKLRRGDTLVRSLNFKNKEEEYHYEIDRNDTHQMLVTMLLQNKGDSVKQATEPLVSRAKELRAQAEKQAANKSFKEAVATLESSTDELVRAIRGAGIFIPG